MTVLTEPPKTTETSVSDRRRPGRPANVNQELLPLLRKDQRENLPLDDADPEFDESDQLRASRGIISGVVLSIPVWAGFAYLVRFLVG